MENSKKRYLLGYRGKTFLTCPGITFFWDKDNWDDIEPWQEQYYYKDENGRAIVKKGYREEDNLIPVYSDDTEENKKRIMCRLVTPKEV